jgi:calcineurin-like phosphoesterase family protein
MEDIWIWSDPHFGHKNIIDYSNRPFSTVEAMDETLAKNWNDRVQPRDRAFMLGDIVFGNPRLREGFLSTLNGRITLVRGNHDVRLLEEFKKGMLNPFEEIVDYKELRVGSDLFVLCHYPMEQWNKAHHGSFMLHGHCHGGMQAKNVGRRRMDVGVDPNGYVPLHIDEIRGRLKLQPLSKHHDL